MPHVLGIGHVWLVPHSLLFVRKPKAIGDVAWLVVDENPIGSALIGAGDPDGADDEDTPSLLTVDTLRRADQIKGDGGGHRAVAHGACAPDRGAGEVERAVAPVGADRGQSASSRAGRRRAIE
jgi:hypothetical protein